MSRWTVWPLRESCILVQRLNATAFHRQVRVDCDRLDADASDVFGRGRRRGLLYWLGNGTLLLNNLNEVRFPDTACGKSPHMSTGLPSGWVCCRYICADA